MCLRQDCATGPPLGATIPRARGGSRPRLPAPPAPGLRLFLRVADAPIDNNAVERVLKHAIRHRRASLFYRTSHGARVGDIYTSLIVTTVLHGGDPIRYLTALFENYNAVAAAPADWLPWTYESALARVELPQAVAA